MLIIEVLMTEAYDEENQMFVPKDLFTLKLEHSLVSLSKWESIFEKPFLGTSDKTPEEIIGYVKAMTLTPEVPGNVFLKLSADNISDINTYIDARMSATWFNEPAGAPRTRDIITSELIYYWMTVFQIPFTCESWHLNRLFTLIKICNIKQAKPKKMSRSEIASRNRELNAQRRAQLGSKG